MPTPVPAAKQCLTPDTATALDEAVSIARQRNHAQTTSLHAITAFLSLPSSPLRDACLRARNHSTTTLHQLRALNFALSLSLDRSPASQHRITEPPISNSLMAAIKRSQANQRRQPENFVGLRDPEREVVGGSVGVKVEMRNLILSILDDPVVSRVFCEAGFSSFDVKIAMVRPVQSFWKWVGFNQPISTWHRRGVPPPSPGVFLYETESYHHHHHRRRPRYHPPPDHPPKFPFLTPGLCPDSADDTVVISSHFKSIAEVMMLGRSQEGERRRNINPLLLGVSAGDTLHLFLQSLEDDKHRHHHLLPPEVRGGGCRVGVINIENEITNFTNDKGGGLVEVKFRELGVMVEERCHKEEMVLCVGDLKSFVDGRRVDVIRSLVLNLTKLWHDHGGKERLWLIGSSSHEVYLKFTGLYPSVQKDWDLRPVVITSKKTDDDMRLKSSSWMGSFVPFAGFFSSPTTTTAAEMKGRSSSPFIPASSSALNVYCRSEKMQQIDQYRAEGGGQCKATLPPPTEVLQEDHETDGTKRINLHHYLSKARDDNDVDDTCMVTATPPTGLQSKLEGTSHPPPPHISSPKPYTCRETGQIPSILPTSKKKAKTTVDDDVHSRSCTTQDATGHHDASCDQMKNVINMADHAQIKPLNPPLIPCLDHLLLPSNTQLNSPPSKPDQLYSCPGHSVGPAIRSDDRISTPHPFSVDTDLILGLPPPLPSSGKVEKGEKPPPRPPTAASTHHKEDFLTTFLPQHRHTGGVSTQTHPPASSCSSFIGFTDHPKSLFESLVARVGRQEDALRVISRTITRLRSSSSRTRPGVGTDIWLRFTGHDVIAQKTAAVAIAELVCGSKDSFVYVDLHSDNAVVGEHANAIGCGGGGSGYDTRRKSMVDQVAERLRKMPLSVVFVESLGCGGAQNSPMQTSLVHAARHGKFVDSHGREVSISNAVFVVVDNKLPKGGTSDEDDYHFHEERVVKARGYSDHPIQLTVSTGSNKISLNNKIRKIIRTHETTTVYADFDTAHNIKGLDLNFPAAEEEEDYDCPAPDDDDNESMSGKSSSSPATVEEIMSRVDSTVVFQPFDYDGLAEKLLVLISQCFSRSFCSDCLLEIESRVMDQILLASLARERKTDYHHWVEEVLGRRFVEARRTYHHHQQPAAAAGHCVVRLVVACGDVGGSASTEDCRSFVVVV